MVPGLSDLLTCARCMRASWLQPYGCRLSVCLACARLYNTLPCSPGVTHGSRKMQSGCARSNSSLFVSPIHRAFAIVFR
jgi:hypothetical protein